MRAAIMTIMTFIYMYMHKNQTLRYKCSLQGFYRAIHDNGHI